MIFRPEQGGTPVLPETSDMFADSYFLRAEIKKNKVGFICWNFKKCLPWGNGFICDKCPFKDGKVIEWNSYLREKKLKNIINGTK